MKLRRIAIQGFRGVPGRLEFAVANDGVCILAENGHGKTTLVDALQILTSGDLDQYHREGYGIDAVVNVDAPFALVNCETSDGATLTRKIERGRVSALEIGGKVDSAAVQPAALPVLRHRTMTRLMDKSPGDKSKDLLELVGLASLIDFRQALTTASNTVVGDADEADRAASGERAALRSIVGSKDPVERAEELRLTAGLMAPVSSEPDLVALRFGARPVATSGDPQTAVAEYARSRAVLDSAVTAEWNAAIEDERAASEMRLVDLLEAAERLLREWTEKRCPLCDQPADSTAISELVSQRLAAVAASRKQQAALRRRLDDHRGKVSAVAGAIRRLIEVPPSGGWPDADELMSSADRLDQYAAALGHAVEVREHAGALPEADLPLSEELSEVVRADSARAEGTKALASLAVLQDAFVRLDKAERKARARREIATAASATLELVNQQVQREIEGAIARLGTKAAEFYGRLVDDVVYSDVQLRFRPERVGGVEFAVTYARRHSVTPPQRVLSESQLNGLGMALFLAHLKVEPQVWRTLVLDDVVNSFDANHRMGLARLLAEEFGDWQVIALTHDRTFTEITRRVLPRWRQVQIVAWSPLGGPVLDDADPLAQLDRRLTSGEAASQLGGLARAALEQALSGPLERLGLEMRLDPFARYGAKEYLDALRHGLRSRNSPLAKMPVLARMDAATYMVNLGAHDRPTDTALTVPDLRQLVEDLEDLKRSFRCPACGEPPWTATLDGGRHHQCRCSQLVV